MLAPTRLGSFQSVYYVLFSKYFPNRIYVKTFKYILPPVSEFSFKCLTDLSQSTELTLGEAVLGCYRQEWIPSVISVLAGWLSSSVFLYSKIALEC